MESAPSRLVMAKLAVLSSTAALAVPWIANATQQQMAQAFALTINYALTWPAVKLMQTVALEVSAPFTAAVPGTSAYQLLAVTRQED